jgi:hypothetical protein
LICFLCYLLELIEKDTLYVRIVKGKIRSKISRFTRNDREVLLRDYKELDPPVSSTGQAYQVRDDVEGWLGMTKGQRFLTAFEMTK